MAQVTKSVNKNTISKLRNLVVEWSCSIAKLKVLDTIFVCVKTPVIAGKIPLRHLVYRVHALPQSLLPLVWDFGTLKSAPYSDDGRLITIGDVESAYIAKMILEFVSTTNYNII